MRVRAGSVSLARQQRGRIGPLDTVFYRTCWTATLGSVRLADPRDRVWSPAGRERH
jgi:hypothetical protein